MGGLYGSDDGSMIFSGIHVDGPGHAGRFESPFSAQRTYDDPALTVAGELDMQERVPPVAQFDDDVENGSRR